ncbi:MAG: precorrin-6y C5,15-methyltransferase (decarboxylating) subunit CbiE [Pseudomonadota bacterium]
MVDTPWLTIIGLGEDGPDGLSPASHQALRAAEIVMGPPRHLALLPDLSCERVEWPVPFSDGLAILDGLRGKTVVVLASGDPFWFGAGSVIARRFARHEWRAFPGSSAFSLAATRLGWPLERVATLGLHAAPLTRLRPHLCCGNRVLVLVRDGEAISDLANWITEAGFGASTLHVMEALGGPRERVRSGPARDCCPDDVIHPVCVGIEPDGDGSPLPLSSGRHDEIFENDGQITKRPIRALTLSTLAPVHGERLWDIGGGSGSIAIEWLMSHPSLSAISIEPREDRAARIRRNAAALGMDHLDVVCGTAPEALTGLDRPDAVFVGGGLSDPLLEWISANLSGTRLVANAVTLESEAVLGRWQARLGGDLMRIDLAMAHPIGSRTGWKSSYPVVQWKVRL